mgnify:CR=1 FL=1
MLESLDKTVVVTGAMLPLEHELTDGQRNLLLSIQVAALGVFAFLVVTRQLAGKLQPIELHLITERVEDGRRLCSGFSDHLPNVLGVWPSTTQPGLPEIAFNANLLTRINRAADKLASQELITQWNRPELGRHPILKPRHSGGSLSPVEWRLSDREAFLICPVQIRG